MDDYQVFNDAEHFEREGAKFLKRLSAYWNWDHRMVLTPTVWREPRTRSQLNLYREWLNRLAEFFSTKNGQFSPDDMHDICRHQFLGYETKRIGNTEIRDQLRSTANGRISRLDMSEYMTKVDHWALDMGCQLPHPDDNEYTKYKRART